MMELWSITTYDGEVYYLTDKHQRFLASTPGDLGIPNLKYITSRAYKQDGETFVDVFAEKRTLTLQHVWSNACNRRAYWQRRQDLINILRPNRGGPFTFTFVQDDGTIRSLTAFVDGPALSEATPQEAWGELDINTGIRLIAFDPIWDGDLNTTFLGCTLVDEHYPALPAVGVDLQNSATNYALLSMPFTPDEDTIEETFLWLQRVNAASGTLTLSLIKDATYHAGLAYGAATDGQSGNVASGTTFTHEADCRLLCVVETYTNNMHIKFRIQDANNYWEVRVTNAAQPGQIELNEIIATVSNGRGSVAAAVLKDDLIMVTMEDETIKVYVGDTLHITYALAVNFKTETDGEVQSTQWRDLGTYPFPTVSEQDATRLESLCSSSFAPASFEFATPATLVVGATYHYVLSTDRAAHASNYITWAGYYRKYLDGLVAMWRFEEATGATRTDSYGENDVSDSGAQDVSQVSGIVDYGAGYSPAATQYLVRPSNRVFRMGDIDFMWLGWLNYTGAGVAASRRVLRKVGVDIDYRLRTRTNDKLRWEVTDDGSTIANVDSNDALANSTDYFVAAYHDAANDEIGVEVNRSRNTAAFALGVYTGNDPFNFGESTAAASTWKGWLDEWYLYKTLQSGVDLDWFYNGGNGRAWSEISPYPERQIRAEVSGAYVRLPYDLAARSVSECNITPADQLVFPIVFPIVFDVADFWGTLTIASGSYSGTWKSRPTITVTGPAQGWHIQHVELDVEVAYLGTINDGDSVTLDLAARTLVDQDGVDRWGYLSPESDLNAFVIQPDGANTFNIYVKGGQKGATGVTIAYKDRYIGL